MNKTSSAAAEIIGLWLWADGMLIPQQRQAFFVACNFMTIRNLIFFLSFILTSCSYSDKDFKLTNDEMKFLNAYKKGDTICFESSLKQIDKMLIVGLDSNQKRQSGYIIAKPAYHEMFISIKHLSADKDNKIDTENESLITISKYPQQTKTNYFISYRHFLFSSDNGLGNLYSDTLFVNNKPITNLDQTILN